MGLPEDPYEGNIDDVRNVWGEFDNLKDAMSKTKEFCEILSVVLGNEYTGHMGTLRICFFEIRVAG